MTFQLVAIRPEPGLTATVARGHALGLTIAGHALSVIRGLSWTPPEPSEVDGLLIGSANAILHGGEALAIFREKPVYAVGEATAAAARAAGFAVAAVGHGGLQGVLDQVPAPARLLRIAGEEHVPLLAPAGVTVTTVIAYRSEALPIDPLVEMLSADGALMLLHSAAIASHFASECKRLNIDRSTIALAALAPRIAAAAGEGWGACHIAPMPDDAALLEMVCKLCQNS